MAVYTVLPHRICCAISESDGTSRSDSCFRQLFITEGLRYIECIENRYLGRIGALNKTIYRATRSIKEEMKKRKKKKKEGTEKRHQLIANLAQRHDSEVEEAFVCFDCHIM